uniref:Uncharacterized protein n=1 Tax=Ditylenchus dipsaci TaxID=166011 RepID=A0A915CP31_9BILA
MHQPQIVQLQGRENIRVYATGLAICFFVPITLSTGKNVDNPVAVYCLLDCSVDIAFSALTYRQFSLWLSGNGYLNHNNYSNYTLVGQLGIYCKHYTSSNDLRIFFTFLMFFGFILIAIQSRRSELIGRLISSGSFK